MLSKMLSKSPFGVGGDPMPCMEENVDSVMEQ